MKDKNNQKKETLLEKQIRLNRVPKSHAWYDSMNENASQNLNKLRAGVLGANDGIVSTAGLILGMVGATANTHIIFMAGLAGLTAGAMSMAVGEYVSVSTQRDTEKALLDLEKQELEEIPEQELEELAHILMKKGISKETSYKAAQEMTKHDALKAHLDFELGIDPDDLTNPMAAAVASAIAFIVGSSIPLIAVKISPINIMFQVILICVALALIVTGYISAKLGRADKKKAVIRNLIGGILAMIITYGIGYAFGVNV